jgi:hypothetical protein
MHNQHAGLSQQLAAQRISERHEQAVRPSGIHIGSVDRSEATMFKLTRVLAIGATLAPSPLPV